MGNEGKLRDEWTSYITQGRWNWSHYLGWFLLPTRKGIFGLCDRLREKRANRKIIPRISKGFDRANPK